MAEKQVKKTLLKFAAGEKFGELSSQGNFGGLGETNFKALENGKEFSAEMTPEIEALIKDKKIIKK